MLFFYQNNWNTTTPCTDRKKDSLGLTFWLGSFLFWPVLTPPTETFWLLAWSGHVQWKRLQQSAAVDISLFNTKLRWVYFYLHHKHISKFQLLVYLEEGCDSVQHKTVLMLGIKKLIFVFLGTFDSILLRVSHVSNFKIID